jgi:hypothetical protein
MQSISYQVQTKLNFYQLDRFQHPLITYFQAYFNLSMQLSLLRSVVSPCPKYALHSPDEGSFGKGKIRKPIEFGGKSAVMVYQEHGLLLHLEQCFGSHSARPCAELRESTY